MCLGMSGFSVLNCRLSGHVGAVSLTCPHRQGESLDLRPFPSLWGIQPFPAILSPGLDLPWPGPVQGRCAKGMGGPR